MPSPTLSHDTSPDDSPMRGPAAVATAFWMGTCEAGRGDLTTESGALDSAPYGPRSQSKANAATCPEELLGAAIAGGYTTSLCNLLDNAGMVAESIETSASLMSDDLAHERHAIHLSVRARVPGLDPGRFESLAQQAIRTAPLIKRLNIEITLKASLEKNLEFAESDQEFSGGPLAAL